MKSTRGRIVVLAKHKAMDLCRGICNWSRHYATNRKKVVGSIHVTVLIDIIIPSEL
jgi:hypothetical protein